MQNFNVMVYHQKHMKSLISLTYLEKFVILKFRDKTEADGISMKKKTTTTTHLNYFEINSHETLLPGFTGKIFLIRVWKIIEKTVEMSSVDKINAKSDCNNGT